jgi:hypothetical protein
MVKSGEKQIIMREHKAKATDGESKHEHKLGSSPFATTFEAIDNYGAVRHSQWRDRFRQLCAYKVQFGHCLVPYRYADNPTLGKWVTIQCRNYKKKEEMATPMPDEHIRALEGIGFDWGTNKTELASIWNVRFQQLLEFRIQFGHCHVPRRYAFNPKLGWWVSSQHRNHKLMQEGKPSPMTEERIRALDGIGFEWGRNKTELASIWVKRFLELCEFKAQVGHCLVAQNYSANITLGGWVKNQRRIYKLYQEGKPTRMSEEHIRALDGIGFDWGTNKTELASIWSVRFRELCEFKSQFGHYLVPYRYADNPKLGLWVKKQRCSYRCHQEGKPSCMTEDRIRTLDSIGFNWGKSQTDCLTYTWSARFEQLLEFKAQFGHYLVPEQYAANPTLGRWVKTQRCSYKLYQEGKPSPMTAEHIRELDSVEFK